MAAAIPSAAVVDGFGLPGAGMCFSRGAQSSSQLLQFPILLNKNTPKFNMENMSHAWNSTDQTISNL